MDDVEVLAVLRLLRDSEEPMHGLQLIKASDGVLKRGTIYVLLGRLEDEGLIRSKYEDKTPQYIGIKRRVYSITSRGRYVALE